MPNLSIKEVPDELAEALRQRAARNHRSLQGELMAIIAQAVAPGDMGLAGAAVSAGAATVEQPPRALTIEEIAARRRERTSGTSLRVPRGVGIIRADRDSR